MSTSFQKYLFILLFLLVGCNIDQKEKTVLNSPAGYNFEDPKKIKLGEDLEEISGIVFEPSSGSLVALNDEEGKLYRVFLDGRPASPGSRFHKGGDYEDLCFDGKHWYALKSNGNLSRILYPFTDSMGSEEFKFPLKEKNEFETIFHDPQNNRLILLCKICKGTGDKVPGYSFGIDNSITDSIPALYLDLSGLPENPLPGKEILKPSAAAFHPLTGELFVIASADRLLIISNPDGKAKEAFVLDKKVFKQPEGLCFSPAGDLYISNEARNGMPNILHFPYSAAIKNKAP